MRPCEICSFGGNDTMCRMPSAMPPDRRTAHLCFCPTRMQVRGAVCHFRGGTWPGTRMPAPPPTRRERIPSWAPLHHPVAMAPRGVPGKGGPALWLLELPPSASVEGRVSQASSSSVSPRPAGAPLDRGRAGRGTSRASSAQWPSARAAPPLAGPDLPTSAARLAALAFSSGSGVRLHAGHGAQSRHF